MHPPRAVSVYIYISSIDCHLLSHPRPDSRSEPEKDIYNTINQTLDDTSLHYSNNTISSIHPHRPKSTIDLKNGRIASSHLIHHSLTRPRCCLSVRHGIPCPAVIAQLGARSGGENNNALTYIIRTERYLSTVVLERVYTKLRQFSPTV